MLEKQEKRHRRHKRIRAKVFGTADKPRLCVFRSEKHIYAQLVNDEKAKTIVSSSDLELKEDKSSSSPTELSQKAKVKKKAELSSSLAAAREGEETSSLLPPRSAREFKKNRGTKINKAKEIGKLIAKKAKDLKIERVVFDRGGYKYHGRVRAVAEGAREAGLIF